ncbi:MAG: prepilin-type N-terminal cleavage/methylation domain-containing protein [Legionellaceae bacterium]|nr:prepilin-type N-terminal cleavage/methylation domain-containing protein [Legionellaceae bacterium]
MTRNRGFSLTEVLVSLLLITSISLALLKQQWQVSQLMQHVLKRFEMLAQSDNERESSFTLRKHQGGFGLMELCISLLLVSCIISGLMQHYLQVKRQYQFTQTSIEEAAELQWVSEWIRMSVRKAGFTPCLSIEYLDTVDQRHEKTPPISLMASNDLLRINRMSDDFVVLSSLPSQGEIHIPSGHLFQYEHPIVIADCYHAEVQQISAIYQTTDGQWLQLDKPLAFTYQSPIYIGPWIEESFFMSRNIQGIQSLAYRLHHTEELTPLVHSMAVTKEQHAGHTLVKISLGLTDGRLRKVDTEARML